MHFACLLIVAAVVIGAVIATRGQPTERPQIGHTTFKRLLEMERTQIRMQHLRKRT